jgi:prepilin-type N-terminal cleavage/methylation domain-containing protein
MIRVSNRIRGFTLVELIVVIVVIGILGTITAVGFTRYQEETRDARRASSVSVITEALERYFQENGEYPSCSAMTSAGDSVSSTLGGIEQATLVAPAAASDKTNSIDFCTELNISSPTDSFAYIGDGSDTCTTTSCLAYTIQYKEESSGSIVSVESRHRSDIATSGTSGNLVANISGAGFEIVQLDWAAVLNATSYKVQRGPSNCSFSYSVDLSPSPTTNTALFTGLTPGTAYCFRIAPVILGSTGAWSNTATATTRDLSTPVLATASSSLGGVSLTWGDISYETAYILEYTSVNGTWSNTPITLTANTTSRTISGLTPGTTYYFRIQATATGDPANKDTSDYSVVVSRAAQQLSTPSTSATETGESSINVTWTDISYETSYTLQYTTSSSSWTSPTPTTLSGLAANSTSQSVTGLTAGMTYYFRLQAVATTPSPGDTSNWSANSSAQTVVSAPTCSTTGGSTNTQIVPEWAAASGATSYTVQYGPGNYGSTISGITGTSSTINGLNNGTTYTSRVQAVAGSASSSWTNCPNRTTGVDGTSSRGWSARGLAVRNSGSVSWMPGEYPGSGNWYSRGMYIYGTCSPGATVVTRLYSYYAYSNNTSKNNTSLLDWTWNNQDRYVVDGNDSWYVWWQGWVACQVGSTRSSSVYLGNAGGY